jgi:geranylgeranyl diphosphate/geranylgeranyl-bacteriochlorophyllide a reductase
MMFSTASVALLAASTASAFTPSAFTGTRLAAVPRGTSALNMKYKVAVVGGGPSGACAAEIFAQEKGIDTVLFERKLDNAKPCGGAIPLCMVGEFNLPETVVDRKVSLLCCRTREKWMDGWMDRLLHITVGMDRICYPGRSLRKF